MALLSTTSQGLNLVPGGLDWQAGDEVILYEMDHPTDIYAWLDLGRPRRGARASSAIATAATRPRTWSG